MEKLQRPPIGLEPKFVHDSKRFYDICDAISRYYNAGCKIPVKWIKEYNELIGSVKHD